MCRSSQRRVRRCRAPPDGEQVSGTFTPVGGEALSFEAGPAQEEGGLYAAREVEGGDATWRYSAV